MTTIAHPSLRAPRPRAVEVEPAHAPSVLEEHRWLLVLSPSFVAGAVFFALAIATGAMWLIGPAVILGPILMMFCFIYLCISTDANGAGWRSS